MEDSCLAFEKVAVRLASNEKDKQVVFFAPKLTKIGRFQIPFKESNSWRSAKIQ